MEFYAIVKKKDSLKQAIKTIYTAPNILNDFTLKAKMSVIEMTQVDEVINKYCSIIESITD